MSLDLFTQEVHNRLRQVPLEKRERNPLAILHLIACDVAEDFLRDNPVALEAVINDAEREARS